MLVIRDELAKPASPVAKGLLPPQRGRKDVGNER